MTKLDNCRANDSYRYKYWTDLVTSSSLSLAIGYRMTVSSLCFWIMFCHESAVADLKDNTDDNTKDLHVLHSLEVYDLVNNDDTSFPYFEKEEEEKEKNAKDGQMSSLNFGVDNSDLEIISQFVWFDFRR